MPYLIWQTICSTPLSHGKNQGEKGKLLVEGIVYVYYATSFSPLVPEATNKVMKAMGIKEDTKLDDPISIEPQYDYKTRDFCLWKSNYLFTSRSIPWKCFSETGVIESREPFCATIISENSGLLLIKLREIGFLNFLQTPLFLSSR